MDQRLKRSLMGVLPLNLGVGWQLTSPGVVWCSFSLVTRWFLSTICSQQVCQWLSNLGKSRDILSIITYKSQELTKFTNGSGWFVLKQCYCFNIAEVWLVAIFGDDMSKITNLLLKKLALTGFQFHATTAKTIQDQL